MEEDSPEKGDLEPPSTFELLTREAKSMSISFRSGRDFLDDADEDDKLTAERVRSQLELRITSEAAVGVPSALLAGAALDMIVNLEMPAMGNMYVRFLTQLEAILLGAVVVINVQVVLMSGLIYWAGLRMFCGTKKSDSFMVKRFKIFW